MTTATTTTAPESFDDRIAREKRAERVMVLGFVAKLNEIKLDGWVAETNEARDPGDLPNSVTFTHAKTGAAFWVSLPNRWSSRNGKVEAHGQWPNDADGSRKSARDWGLHGYNESDPHQIGFSFTKTAKAIAGDLSRRLVPGLLEGIATINVKLAAQQAAQDGISADVERLKEVFNTHDVREQTYYGAKLHWHEYTSIDGRVLSGGGIGVDGNLKLSNYRSKETGQNSVDLELSNLTVDQAIAIAELLKGDQS